MAGVSPQGCRAVRSLPCPVQAALEEEEFAVCCVHSQLLVSPWRAVKNEAAVGGLWRACNCH